MCRTGNVLFFCLSFCFFHNNVSHNIINPINIYQFTLCMLAETHEVLQVNGPLLFHFNKELKCVDRC